MSARCVSLSVSVLLSLSVLACGCALRLEHVT